MSALETRAKSTFQTYLCDTKENKLEMQINGKKKDVSGHSVSELEISMLGRKRPERDNGSDNELEALIKEEIQDIIGSMIYLIDSIMAEAEKLKQEKIAEDSATLENNYVKTIEFCNSQIQKLEDLVSKQFIPEIDSMLHDINRKARDMLSHDISHDLIRQKLLDCGKKLTAHLNLKMDVVQRKNKETKLKLFKKAADAAHGHFERKINELITNILIKPVGNIEEVLHPLGKEANTTFLSCVPENMQKDDTDMKNEIEALWAFFERSFDRVRRENKQSLLKEEKRLADLKLADSLARKYLQVQTTELSEKLNKKSEPNIDNTINDLKNTAEKTFKKSITTGDFVNHQTELNAKIEALILEFDDVFLRIKNKNERAKSEEVRKENIAIAEDAIGKAKAYLDAELARIQKDVAVKYNSDVEHLLQDVQKRAKEMFMSALSKLKIEELQKGDKFKDFISLQEPHFSLIRQANNETKIREEKRAAELQSADRRAREFLDAQLKKLKAKVTEKSEPNIETFLSDIKKQSEDHFLSMITIDDLKNDKITLNAKLKGLIANAEQSFKSIRDQNNQTKNDEIRKENEKISNLNSAIEAATSSLNMQLSPLYSRYDPNIETTIANLLKRIEDVFKSNLTAATKNDQNLVEQKIKELMARSQDALNSLRTENNRKKQQEDLRIQAEQNAMQQRLFMVDFNNGYGGRCTATTQRGTRCTFSRPCHHHPWG
ncbi:hypothetical protein BKA69DRAFT_1104943 [Paraphysoderma sedebokerense]|nr:hypothetical protein BKA69DRAFT_1104943 [Paraphysoderma sedebokerense]